MTRSQVTTCLAELLADLGLDAGTLHDDQNLRNALQVDSLDLISLAIAVHDRFGIEIEVADAERLTTVGDVVDLLQRKLADRPPPAQAA